MLLHKLKHTPGRGTTALKSALLVSAAAACIGIMSTSAASAGTIVTEWDFMLDNAFTSWTQTGSGGDIMGSDINAKIGAPSKLSWGEPFLPDNPMGIQSSLAIGFDNGNFDSRFDGGPMNNMNTPIVTGIDASLSPPAMPADVGPGNVVPTVKVTHMNFPQEVGSAALETAVLTDILTLEPTKPTGMPPAGFDGDQSFSPVALAFNILFAETNNTVNDGGATDDGDNCADMTSPDGGGCNDIFVLDVPAAAFDPMDQSLNQGFVFDDFKYNAKIQLEGIGVMGMGLRNLTDKECQAVGASTNLDGGADIGLFDNCIGLTTIENQTNDFQAFLSIQLIGAAPEPGALAIFGLGLAGLGFMRRRRKV